jgi:hypothetical protein
MVKTLQNLDLFIYFFQYLRVILSLGVRIQSLLKMRVPQSAYIECGFETLCILNEVRYLKNSA